MAVPSSQDLQQETRSKHVFGGRDFIPLPAPVTRLGCSSKGKGRKRYREDMIATSSDPPLFSSDDLPSSSLENYKRPRTKPQRRHAWYEIDTHEAPQTSTQELSIPRRKGMFCRSFDSGIFLSSDDSSTACDGKHFGIDEYNPESVISNSNTRGQFLTSFDCQQIDLAQKALQQVGDPDEFHGPVFPYWQTQPENLDAFHAAQRIAAARIASCVESGTQSIDLSSLDLEQIRCATLSPLQHLINHKASDGAQFSSLRPSLQLYLSNNNLREVPGQVYQLIDTSILSLRNNRLTHLLPAICQLQNLRQLNLACNQLAYLPWELFQTYKAAHQTSNPLTINYLPNRFLQAQLPSSLCQVVCETKPLSESANATSDPPLGPTLLRTRTIFLSKSGRSLPNCPPRPCQPQSTHQVDEARTADSPAPDHTPSLLELALRSCHRHASNLHQTPFLLSASSDKCENGDSQPAHAPAYMIQLLKDTFRLQEATGSQEQKCTVCAKSYIMPRTEWIEWHSMDLGAAEPITAQNQIKQQSLVPFLRAGCSWACHTESADHGTVYCGWTRPDSDDV